MAQIKLYYDDRSERMMSSHEYDIFWTSELVIGTYSFYVKRWSVPKALTYVTNDNSSSVSRKTENNERPYKHVTHMTSRGLVSNYKQGSPRGGRGRIMHTQRDLNESNNKQEENIARTAVKGKLEKRFTIQKYSLPPSWLSEPFLASVSSPSP